MAIGNLGIMKWLYENGVPWTREIFSKAAEHGDLEVLKWFFEKECPWGKGTFAGAAYHGDLVNMEWLYEKECPWGRAPIDFRQCFVTSIKENILQWMRVHGCPKV